MREIEIFHTNNKCNITDTSRTTAEIIEDLRIPPGNKLEKLSGNLSGKYCIRINNQWRIIFNWKNNNAHEVEIIDYHKG